MKRKDLQHIILDTSNLNSEIETVNSKEFITAEGIDLKETYSKQDIENH